MLVHQSVCWFYNLCASSVQAIMVRSLSNDPYFVVCSFYFVDLLTLSLISGAGEIMNGHPPISQHRWRCGRCDDPRTLSHTLTKRRKYWRMQLHTATWTNVSTQTSSYTQACCDDPRTLHTLLQTSTQRYLHMHTRVHTRTCALAHIVA